jgi:beta-glucosidase/6-phospho-beta-glucosidase/beta-galactosidase
MLADLGFNSYRFSLMSGFEPKFGIVAVDLVTQRRTIKPSGAMLGNIARRNSL